MSSNSHFTGLINNVIFIIIYMMIVVVLLVILFKKNGGVDKIVAIMITCHMILLMIIHSLEVSWNALLISESYGIIISSQVEIIYACKTLFEFISPIIAMITTWIYMFNNYQFSQKKVIAGVLTCIVSIFCIFLTVVWTLLIMLPNNRTMLIGVYMTFIWLIIAATIVAVKLLAGLNESNAWKMIFVPIITGVNTLMHLYDYGNIWAIFVGLATTSILYYLE